MKVLIIIFLLFSLTVVSANDFCQDHVYPDRYLKMKSDIDKKLDAFANSKVIAKHADSVILKLIEGKSPFIDSWYKKGNFKGKTEDQVAKSWRQYYTRNFILMKYPHGNSEIDVAVEKFIDAILLQSFNKNFKNQLEKDFSKTKKLALETITKMNLPQSKGIIKKIKDIKLFWPTHLKIASNNSIPLDLIEWGIAYDPISNKINIGLNSYSYGNEETLIAVFAHEIGHSFDSCRWNAFFDGQWPFEKVGQCLRSEKSIGAKLRDDSQLEALKNSQKITAELMLALKANPTCNKRIYPTGGIQADQLSETFADWFSAEVISSYKNLNVSKLRLDLCEDSKLVEGSSYPANQLRLSKIYYAHPVIKKLIKTTGDNNNYCSL